MDKVYTVPFSDQNATKTQPFGAAHTYMADIWEDPPRGIIFAGPALQRCRCSVLHWMSKTWVRVRVTPPNSGCWLYLQSTVLHRLLETWVRYSLSPPAGHWYQIQICISARLMSSELKNTISLFQSKNFSRFPWIKFLCRHYLYRVQKERGAVMKFNYLACEFTAHWMMK